MKKENGVLLEVTNKDLDLLKNEPDKFWENVTIIGEYAFWDCSEPLIVEIPSHVEIGTKAFYGVGNLEKIVINEGIKCIGEDAFSNCSSLKEIVLPSSIEVIESDAFKDCDSLERVVLNKGLRKIGSFAFGNCYSLKEIEIPDSVDSIEEYAFSNNENLEKIILSKNITNIGDRCFSDCKIREIELHDNIKQIGEEAFYGCDSLEKVKLGKGVEYIGWQAFLTCKNLQKIEIFQNNCKIKELFLDYNKFYGICVNSDGYTAVVKNNNEDTDKTIISYPIKNIIDAFPGIETETYKLNLNDFITDKKRITDLIKKAHYFNKLGISIPIRMFNTYEDFKKVTSKEYKKLATLLSQIDGNKSSVNMIEFYKLANNMGLLEDNDISIQVNGKKVPVSDVAYTALQGAFKKGYLNIDDMHSRFHSMKFDEYNEEFLKFMANKTNLGDLKEADNEQNGLTTKIYKWFQERKKGNLEAGVSEENRYKIITYETTETGIDKIKWKSPTVSLFKKEFAEQKFTNISEDSKDIAEYLSSFNLYGQKHFEKAVQIDRERKRLRVKDHITEDVVKEDLIESLEDYKKRTEKLKEEIIKETKEASEKQIDTASMIFTYEMLAKSDRANFAMGFLTDSCATLYGAGAGAQRAMIIHPDMQPLVIRDIRGNIVCFGIVYVNRKEGYAVVNNFEVNKKYMGNDAVRKEIYTKALQGIDAFVKQYNKENEENPITIVTCGKTPNWDAINDFIEKHSWTSFLKVPDFNEFKYVGSGEWRGDWFYNQRVIWKSPKNEIKRG